LISQNTLLKKSKEKQHITLYHNKPSSRRAVRFGNTWFCE